MKKIKKNLALILAIVFVLTTIMPALNDVQAASKYQIKLTNGKSVPTQIYKTSSISLKLNKGKATYSSSNSKVLKVSSSGKVTAVTTGTATVYAKIKKKVVAKKSIKVVAPKLTLSNGKAVPTILYTGQAITQKQAESLQLIVQAIRKWQL